MDQLLLSIGHWAESQGIGTIMLLFAIFWLNNQNKKAAADVKSALDTTASERNARLGLMEQAVQTLTTRVNECEKDRQGLWAHIVDLAKKQGHNTAKVDMLASHEPK